MPGRRDPRSAPHSDPDRIGRFGRTPQLGPRLLFFTGGSALRPLCRVVKRYTHNSIHLVTPFDSGGSSKGLRDAFDMLSVGDLRNRLLALADETGRAEPELGRFLGRRLAADAAPPVLATELGELVRGSHRWIQPVPEPARGLLCRLLGCFADRRPADFDLRGASVGNLAMAGAYLSAGRDIGAVMRLFARLLWVRGRVLPIVDTSLHLVAVLADGVEVTGQHRITGKDHPPVEQRIASLHLVDGRGARAACAVDDSVAGLITGADLLCYPLGSFWTSVVANLLPAGVGRAIAAADAPRVFVPNPGRDPEMVGMGIHDAVRVLHRVVAGDAGDLPVGRVVSHVLVDSNGADYQGRLDLDRLRGTGVEVLDAALVGAEPDRFDPERLAGALLSLC